MNGTDSWIRFSTKSAPRSTSIVRIPPAIATLEKFVPLSKFAFLVEFEPVDESGPLSDSNRFRKSCAGGVDEKIQSETLWAVATAPTKSAAVAKLADCARLRALWELIPWRFESSRPHR